MSRYSFIYFNIKDNHFLYLKDRITTSSTPQINIGAVIAGVLAGALFTLIIGLVVFFIWKRRTKKKSFTFSASNSTTATIPPSEPIVVPALYNLSLSQRDSNETSPETVTYHLYDELP
jgi:uncharacterized membrane protein YraQ (UPF0718 family)